MAPSFKYPAPAIQDDVLRISFPAEHVLFLAMNRPKVYNAMNASLEAAMNATLDWFEREPSLYVAIIGSTQKKAWCAGQDLKEMKASRDTDGRAKLEKSKNGFGGISTRYTKKPVIGAINGFAMGGGSEMVVNLDLAVAGQSATFGFPEAKRGVTVGAGGVPRLARLVGHNKAMELCLTGRPIPAQEALQLRILNAVVPDDQVDAEAVKLASQIAANSPDSIRHLVQAVRLSNEVASVDRAFSLSMGSAENDAVWEGENIQEGLNAFAEKREPRWRPSKL